MRYSKLFGKTIRDVPKDEVSLNARLLIRGGFVRKEAAGIYNFLPLGLLVLNKIANIVREEMNKAGGQELLLASLQNKNSWEKTTRWKSFDVLFKVKSQLETEYALGPTHEEVLVPIVKQFVNSYKDLPLYLYQIQNKFRDELRSKSGLLRGREFLMKDLYSFHISEDDFNLYYEKMKSVYIEIFKRCGLSAILTEASGGTFSDFSHEFQVLTNSGEDEIIYCPKGHYGSNLEVSKIKEGDECTEGHGKYKRGKAIEVGNIFPLKTKFSEAFDLTYKDKNGKDNFVIMGCYGIGITRLIGTVAEVHNDEKGIIWPKSVAPFQTHLIGLNVEKANDVYEKLKKIGVEVLYDDRNDVSAGEKFADCDLIGIPIRLVVSDKSGDKIEIKKRTEEKTNLISFEELQKLL